MGEGRRAVAVPRSLQRRAGQSTIAGGTSCCPASKGREQLIGDRGARLLGGEWDAQVCRPVSRPAPLTQRGKGLEYLLVSDRTLFKTFPKEISIFLQVLSLRKINSRSVK